MKVFTKVLIGGTALTSFVGVGTPAGAAPIAPTRPPKACSVEDFGYTELHSQIGGLPLVLGGTEQAANKAAAAALVGAPVDLGGNHTHEPGTTFSRHTTEPMGHG